MNYIKQLQADNAGLKAKVEEALAEIQALKVYLHSDKFAGPCENYVNTSDVLHRLNDISRPLWDAGHI